MSKADQVKAILDRTIKDITALKAICPDPATCEYIDTAANNWLLCLHSLEACYKSDDI